MKDFKPITKKKQLKAICAALNKIFWKVPGIDCYETNPVTHYDNDDSAEYWVAELYDRGIIIKWNKKKHKRANSEKE